MPSHRPSEAASPSDRFSSVTDHLIAPVVVLSADGRIDYVNLAAATLLRQDRSWLLGRQFDELVHPSDGRRLSHMIATVAAGRPSGRHAVLRVRAQASLDWRIFECTADKLAAEPDATGILLSLHDITTSRAENDALTKLAYRDPLTGLPNRTSLVSDIGRLLGEGRDVAILLVGVDRLSLLEDSLGRAGSEAVIEAIGRRLRAAVPASAPVGRLEGGTYAAILSDRVARQAMGIAWRALERSRGPIFVGTREVQTTVSLGLASSGADATVESLLWDAGLALHRAEAAGGGRVEVFNDGLRAEVISRLGLEADLRRAIADQGLALAFQPIVRLDNRVVVASEALLRWHHADGDVAPSQFVRIAESAGLIVPLGEWVATQAARRAGQAPGGVVSINLSPRQLADAGLPRILDGLVAAHGARSAVQFEITETLLIEEWEHTSGILAELRRLGFRVGLDDFGTGYSSLGYLRQLPLDFLKIDRSLVADVDVDRQARAIVGAIINMADALDLDVVAEGVERESQARVLADLGAEEAQGHLFGAAAELVRSEAQATPPPQDA